MTKKIYEKVISQHKYCVKPFTFLLLLLSFLLLSHVFHNCESNVIDIEGVNDEVDYIVDCQTSFKINLEDHAAIHSIIINEGSGAAHLSCNTDYINTRLVFNDDITIRFLNNCTFREIVLHKKPVIEQADETLIKVINVYSDFDNIPFQYMNKYNLPDMLNKKLLASSETIKICYADNISNCPESYLTYYDFSNAPENSNIEILIQIYNNMILFFSDEKKLNSVTITCISQILVGLNSLIVNSLTLKGGNFKFFSCCSLNELRVTECNVFGNCECCQLFTLNSTFEKEISIINGSLANTVTGANYMFDKVSIISTCDTVMINSITINNAIIYGNIFFGSSTDVLNPIIIRGNAISRASKKFNIIICGLEDGETYKDIQYVNFKGKSC